MPKFKGDDWSWLAGIFEGEGTATVTTNGDRNNRRYDRLVMTVAQKQRDMLDEVKRITGVGSIHYQASWQGFQWSTASLSARVTLRKLLPYMRSIRKRLQVEDALAQDSIARIAGRERMKVNSARRTDPVTGRFCAKVS